MHGAVVALGVGLADPVEVIVGVALETAEWVGDEVTVAVDVAVCSTVDVARGAVVGDTMAVPVAVGLAVAVGVANRVAVVVGISVDVALGVGVGVEEAVDV